MLFFVARLNDVVAVYQHGAFSDRVYKPELRGAAYRIPQHSNKNEKVTTTTQTQIVHLVLIHNDASSPINDQAAHFIHVIHASN